MEIGAGFLSEHVMKRNIVVAITGASGVLYAIRLLEVLLAAGCDVFLSISEAGRLVLEEELGLKVDLDNFDPAMLKLAIKTRASELGLLRYCRFDDWSAPIASGSFHTDGMVICPCSTRTLGAIAHGVSTNLVHRAAEVHLKERRRLILVPRETPLSLVQLRNLMLAAEAGAVILPAMPAFYHGAKRVSDLVDFIVSRICDQLGLENALVKRWGENKGDEVKA